MNVLNKILTEIKELKRKQNSNNQDYYVGYINALSTVEGIISIMDDDKDAKIHDSDESYMMFTLNENGIAKKYDNTYDVTIHCESKEEQAEICNILENHHDWTPADNPPKPDEYVLLSFWGWPLPGVGIYREDEDGGGAYYLDNNDISCSNYGIIVNGWMPLPKNME